MGKRGKGSILGAINGKVGTVIITNWRGIDVVKSLPHWRKGKPNFSDAQKAQQDLFKSVAAFLAKVGGTIERGFQMPNKSKMTAMNAAVSYHLLHAIVGTSPNSAIDFSCVKFSRPIYRTDNGWNIAFGVDETSQLEVTWDLNPFPDKSTRQDDCAVLIYHSERMGGLHLATNFAARKSLGYKLPMFLTEYSDEISCWVYFISKDKKRVSETKYLGAISIEI